MGALAFFFFTVFWCAGYGQDGRFFCFVLCAACVVYRGRHTGDYM